MSTSPVDPVMDSSSNKDEVAKAKLAAAYSDTLLNELEPVYWLQNAQKIGKGSADDQFLAQVFPLLGRYHRSVELEQLIKENPWLSGLTSLTHRHEAVQEFQLKAAQNIDILKLFVRLKFCATFGKPFMRITYCGIYYELIELPFYPKYSGIREPDPTGTLNSNGLDYQRPQEVLGKAWEELGVKCKSAIAVSQRLSAASWIAAGNWLRSVSEEDLKGAITEFIKNMDFAYEYAQDEVASLWILFERSTGTDESRKGSLQWIPASVMNSWFVLCDPVWFEIRLAWQTVVNDVRLFCLAAGAEEASSTNPLTSIEHLRIATSRQFAYTADLHKTIGNLNRQIAKQQRMITALRYRHIMENLIKDLQSKESATRRWNSFLTSTNDYYKEWFASKSEDEKKVLGTIDKSQKHPLHDFITKYGNKAGFVIDNGIQTMTRDLYGTLSRTIHDHPLEKADLFAIYDTQYDPMQIDFMRALEPEHWDNEAFGEVKWEQEQSRFKGAKDNSKGEGNSSKRESNGYNSVDDDPTSGTSKSKGKKNKGKKWKRTSDF
ncbi:hypothetical protein BDV96DRAFT_653559 [Lophiotrema nucula]|uniref:Uncharacterized protein n=1 Tax=Lophiotrema nucula TaxID=690887 RepID=A0A6A5YKZ9_9PLEO|nr:hypothetical protein BDV96DRAFT_653559 [Lophiotrema nucula]